MIPLELGTTSPAAAPGAQAGMLTQTTKIPAVFGRWRCCPAAQMLFPIQAAFGGIRAECELVLNPNQELPLKGLCCFSPYFFQAHQDLGVNSGIVTCTRMFLAGSGLLSVVKCLEHPQLLGSLIFLFFFFPMKRNFLKREASAISRAK